MSTAVVVYSDKGYFEKAKKTIHEVRTTGEWTGDIVFMAVDFDPEPIEGVEIHKVAHISTDALAEQHRLFPFLEPTDNRHLTMTYQWDKLQVFTPFFRKWERIFYIDAGMRIANPIAPILDVEWRGSIVAPEDSDIPTGSSIRFRDQLEKVGNPAALDDLFSIYSDTILGERYLLNSLFVYDTSILDIVTFEKLVETMNRFPIARCNEMTIMNLQFVFKYKVWKRMPIRIGDKVSFGFNEHQSVAGTSHWSEFICLKYPFGMP